MFRLSRLNFLCIAWLLLVLVVPNFSCASASAASMQTILIDGVKYTINGVGTAYVSGHEYTTLDSNLTIRGSVNIGGSEYSVKSIGENAFADTGIFVSTTSLASIIIPDSVEQIGQSAFAGSGLTSIDFPKSLTTIGVSAFYGTRLRSVLVGPSVQTIGEGAFTCAWGSDMSFVTIGASVKKIGSNAFDRCGTPTVTFEGAAPLMDTSVFNRGRPHVFFYSKFGRGFVSSGYTAPFWNGWRSSEIGEPMSSTPTVSVSGTAKVANTLIAQVGSWDAGVVLSYQWFRGGLPLADETLSQYKVGSNDLDSKITVEVTGVKPGFTSVSVTSLPTSEVVDTLYTMVDWVQYRLDEGSFASVVSTGGCNDCTIRSSVSFDGTSYDVTNIEGYAFYNPVTYSVWVPGTVKSLSNSAFQTSSQRVAVFFTGPPPSNVDQNAFPRGNSQIFYFERFDSRVIQGGFSSSWAGELVPAYSQPEPLESTPTPSISGGYRVGERLIVAAGSWDEGVELSYDWFRDGLAIDQAHGTFYDLSPIDSGADVTVSVTGVKQYFSSVIRTSNPISVMAGEIPLAPKVIGAATVGRTLMATTGLENSNLIPDFKFQWNRNGLAVNGATSQSYLLTGFDLGAVVSVTVSVSKVGYGSIVKTSDPTKTVAAGLFTRTSTPTISGAVAVGSALTLTPGFWDSGVDLTFQWSRNKTQIIGANSITYSPTEEDLGATLSATIIGSKQGFVSETKTSLATVIVALGVLRPVGKPTLSGSCKVGQTVVGQPGTWQPGVKLTYAWLLDGKPIKNATSNKYKIGKTLKGHFMSFSVSAYKKGFKTAIVATSKKKVE